MRQRSSYPKPFKAQVVQECLQPGASYLVFRNLGLFITTPRLEGRS